MIAKGDERLPKTSLLSASLCLYHDEPAQGERSQERRREGDAGDTAPRENARRVKPFVR